jgi:hypothetical protein
MAVNFVADYSEDENAKNTLFDEIKKQFDRYEELKKGLDNKANTMITISTAISTLFIAVGTFLISKIDPKNEIFFGSIAILSLGLILLTLAISYFIRSYSLKEYYYAFTHRLFFDDDEKYNKKFANKVQMLSKTEFIELMIKQYLKGLKSFYEQNDKKAHDIIKGQILLLSSVSLVGILLGFILISLGVHLIKII